MLSAEKDTCARDVSLKKTWASACTCACGWIQHASEAVLLSGVSGDYSGVPGGAEGGGACADGTVARQRTGRGARVNTFSTQICCFRAAVLRARGRREGGGAQGRDRVCNTLLRCRAISHHERPVTESPACFWLSSTQVAPNALEGLASASTEFTRGVHVFICACLGECVRVRLRAHARERTCRCSAGEA